MKNMLRFFFWTKFQRTTVVSRFSRKVPEVSTNIVPSSGCAWKNKKVLSVYEWKEEDEVGQAILSLDTAGSLAVSSDVIVYQGE